MNIVENKKNTIAKWLHHLMALVGGFMGGYAVLTRADFLGNAQTSNLLFLVYAIIGKKPLEVLIRVGAVLLYVFAAILFVYIKNKTKINVKYVSVLIDLVAVIVLAFIPKDANVILALYPIFFAMSFQWNSFPGSYGYQSSTIFSTNNVRQVSLSIGEYLCNKDRTQLHKARFFAGTLMCFHVGVVFAYFSSKSFGVIGILFNAIPILLAIPVIIYEERLTEELLVVRKNARNYSKLDCKSA